MPLTEAREPFDSTGIYYPIAIFMAGILATLVAPRCWKMAVEEIFMGEQLWAFLFLPETRAYLLFGIEVDILISFRLPTALGDVSV